MRWILPWLLVLILSPSVAAQDQETGYHAYMRGDYETARANFGPLAERGDRNSQIFIAIIHFRGYGVPRDAVEGLKWATLANHKRTRETMLAVMTGAEIAEARRRAREWEARRR